MTLLLTFPLFFKVNWKGYFHLSWHLVWNSIEFDKSREQSSSGFIYQFASARALPVILAWLNTVRGMTVSDYIIRLSEMCIQARLYTAQRPTGGFLAWFTGPACAISAWCWVSRRAQRWVGENRLAPLAPREQRPLCCPRTRPGTRTKEETCRIQLLQCQTSPYLT